MPITICNKRFAISHAGGYRITVITPVFQTGDRGPTPLTRSNHMDKIQTDNLNKIFNFLHQAAKLKTTFRFGAEENSIKESSADHSWRLALMTFIVADELKINIDINKAMRIALIHDIAEALTGDIDTVLIYEGKFNKNKKHKLELTALNKIKNTLPPMTGKQILDLWHEYENSSSREAKFVKALDKIETLTQITEAGYKTYSKPQFIPNYADKAVNNFPDLMPMLKMAKEKLRAEFKKGGLVWKKEYSKNNGIVQ
jgi:putative hydrolases of HD superfamily